MSKFYKKLKAGLDEIIAHQEGKIHLRTISIEVPEPPARYKPKEIKKIRKEKNCSQSIFAKMLNVSPRTIQSWESGIRKPSQSALRVLDLIDRNIYNPQIIKRR